MNINVDISNVKLKTKRLILRPFETDDVYDLYEYAKVEGVGERAGWVHHKDIDESLSILNMFIAGKRTFAIVLKEENKVIGSLGLEEYDEKLLPEFADLKGLEIGYVIGKDYWGRGLVPEAVRAVLSYCFDVLMLDFLCLGYFDYNTQSKRVNEKSGFEFVIHRSFKTRYGTNEEGVLTMLTRDNYHKKLKEGFYDNKSF
ncbi:MAG: GNAT family N-acetyltransferase [Christensenellaceae bacterium]|nr:GNAT family N-acetyltransferase [Christensenellaceae bacterium]